MNNQSNIFYYFNDGAKFDSKLLSSEYEKQKKQSSILYYHDDIFSKLNWKFEPPNSLDYYYIEQAKKIRDEYDYIMLCYSGGIDSTNILETFYYNNIKLDKIITFGALSQDSFNGDDRNNNGELYYNVFPTIKKLNLENIHEVIDYTKYFECLDKFSITQSKNWIEETGSWFSPHHWIWRDLYKIAVPLNMQNKKVAIIFGKDKPYIEKDQFGIYFHFNDSVINSYGYFKGVDKIDVINFYWDPSYPLILLKQLHILKKIYLLNNRSYIDSQQTQVINNINIKKLIYDIKNPLSFISRKSPSKIVSIRDSYILNKKNSNVYELFSKGIKELKNRLGDTTIPITYSRKYYIS